MKRTINAIISRGEHGYVGRCLDIAAVTQGETLDETVANLREAAALFLDGEDPADFGLAPDPVLMISIEEELAVHAG